MSTSDNMVTSIGDVSHLLIGVKTRVWEQALSKDRMDVELYRVWLDNGWMGPNGNLTEVGEDLVENAMFIQYELNVAFDQSVARYPTTKEENYTMLREALGRTFLNKIRPLFFNTMDGIVKDGNRVLDFCCGNGDYSISLYNVYARLTIDLVDKNPQVEDHRALKMDVLKHRAWCNNRVALYDVVLANEIIHCLSSIDIETVLADICYMTKKGGYLVVGEQRPTNRMAIRMAAYTGGMMYSSAKMVARILVCSSDLEFVDSHSNDDHYFLIFRVIK